MIYYVLTDAGPEPRTIEELAQMREAGELSDDTFIKQGSGGSWLTFQQLFEEEVEMVAKSGTGPTPPLPVKLAENEPASQSAPHGFFIHWKWIVFGIVVIAVLLLSEGNSQEKRFHELLRGAVIGVCFVCFGLIAKLSAWIERQGGFKKAWNVFIAGKSRRSDNKAVLKKKP